MEYTGGGKAAAGATIFCLIILYATWSPLLKGSGLNIYKRDKKLSRISFVSSEKTNKNERIAAWICVLLITALAGKVISFFW